MKSAKGRESTFDFTKERRCSSCGNKFFGRYCNRCGEEVIVHGEKSFRNAFLHSFQSTILWESQFIHTLSLIVRTPGQFSLNYINGIRVPFIRPVALFLIVNLLYFLFPVFETFDAPLRTQMHFLPHKEIATQLVDQLIDEHGTNLADFTVRYEQHSSSLAIQLLILFAVLSAVPIALINYSNESYFIDHLIVSFEFNSLVIFVTHLLLPWSLTLIISILATMGIDASFLLNGLLFSVMVMGICLFVFYLFEKRVYGQKNRRAWLKSFLMIAGLFIALQVYRIILFFVTILTL
jgi:Protein of unknown function (DUF3667)